MRICLCLALVSLTACINDPAVNPKGSDGPAEPLTEMERELLVEKERARLLEYREKNATSDLDQDGVLNSVDACLRTAGSQENEGCPVYAPTCEDASGAPASCAQSPDVLEGRVVSVLKTTDFTDSAQMPTFYYTGANINDWSSAVSSWNTTPSTNSATLGFAADQRVGLALEQTATGPELHVFAGSMTSGAEPNLYVPSTTLEKGARSSFHFASTSDVMGEARVVAQDGVFPLSLWAEGSVGGISLPVKMHRAYVEANVVEGEVDRGLIVGVVSVSELQRSYATKLEEMCACALPDAGLPLIEFGEPDSAFVASQDVLNMSACTLDEAISCNAVSWFADYVNAVAFTSSVHLGALDRDCLDPAENLVCDGITVALDFEVEASVPVTLTQP